MIKVEKADNGWVVHYDDYLIGEDDKDVLVVNKVVIEEPEKFTDEEVSLEHCKAIRSLLYTILDKLDEHDSKHNSYHYDVVVKDKDYKEVELY